MAAILVRHGLFYGAVPKVACTSLKEMFFLLENGFAFRPYLANGAWRHVHNAVYRTLRREHYPEARIAGMHRIAVVRDPVARVLSAYGNRVVHHRELSAAAAGEALGARGLEPDPPLDLFLDRFEDYRAASEPIHYHTMPMVRFLGPDPGYFHRIYGMGALDRLVADVSERTGTALTLGRSQTEGPKFAPGDLTAAQIARLETFYRRDYRVFRDYLDG
jgi:hypothetical protein